MKLIAYLLFITFAFSGSSYFTLSVTQPLIKEITAYPFFTSPTRAELICNNYKKIAVGMTSKDVKAILSAPNEIHPLYEPKMKNAKQIDYTYSYVLRCLARSGSVNDKQEIGFLIRFSKENRVFRIDEIGF